MDDNVSLLKAGVIGSLISAVVCGIGLKVFHTVSVFAYQIYKLF